MFQKNNCKVVIVGDEILSGKRKDAHLSKSIELLTSYSLYLSEVRYLPDDLNTLVRVYKEMLTGEHILFSFGGIGATPDDCTREAVAKALDVSLEPHPEGVAILEAKFGQEAYPDRIKMVEFPQGASLIPNPFNQIPGFSIQQRYFLPGFPEMAWPMMDWILQHQYSNIQRSIFQSSVLVDEAIEGRLIALMESIIQRYPLLKLFSLPRYKEKGGRELELGVRGADPAQIGEAMTLIKQELNHIGYTWVVIE